MAAFAPDGPADPATQRTYVAVPFAQQDRLRAYDGNGDSLNNPPIVPDPVCQGGGWFCQIGGLATDRDGFLYEAVGLSTSSQGTITAWELVKLDPTDLHVIATPATVGDAGVVPPVVDLAIGPDADGDPLLYALSGNTLLNTTGTADQSVRVVRRRGWVPPGSSPPGARRHSVPSLLARSACWPVVWVCNPTAWWVCRG